MICMKLKNAIALLFAFFVLSGSLSVSAITDGATESFTHKDGVGSQIVETMSDVFTPDFVFDARKLELSDSIEKITDICNDSDGNLYILCEEGKIIVTDVNGKYISDYLIFDLEGNELDFSGSKGISFSNGEIMVADTLHNRVICSKNGKAVGFLEIPKNGLIPSDFSFAPTKVQRDGKGYSYVISEGSYYGAVMYDPNGEFSGFYGANTVKSTVLTTLSNIWDSLTQNDIKRAKKVKVLPYQFIDISISDSDFIYTCTGQTSDESGQLKMLSPGGTNILYKKQYNGSYISASSFSFGEENYAKRLNKKISQNFGSIDVDGNNFIYALDRTYGLIYVYDSECNLLTCFGGGRGLGSRNGVFTSTTSLSVFDNYVFVADDQNNNITRFSVTYFGENLLKAQKLTLDSNYKDAEPYWNNVLKIDARNNLAIRGLAKNDLVSGNYKEALKKAKNCSDYSIYGQALKNQINDFLVENFVWLTALALLFVVSIVFLIVYKKRKDIKIIKNEKISLLFKSFAHPFDTFNAVRYKDMGSIKISIVLLVLFYLSSVLSVLLCNFRFSSFDEQTYNSIFQLFQTVGLAVLFSVANWGISVLMQGIGKFKHVFIVVSYSVLPIIVFNLIIIPLSFIITSPASPLINGLRIVAYIMTGIVICVGLMKVHDIAFPRFVATILISGFFMFLIVFVLFVFCILASQLWSFIATLFIEAIYR